jgi:hypothetical protein
MRRPVLIIFWFTAFAALAIYAAMVGWSLPTISAAAGNRPAFDLQPFGYSFAEASEFLTALSPEGRGLYRGTQLWLDTFYPPLFGLFIALGLWIIAPTQGGRLQKLLPLLGLPVAVFDLLENHFVARLLDAAAATPGQDVVQAASLMTILKTLSTSVALTVLLVFVALWAWRSWRRR